MVGAFTPTGQERAGRQRQRHSALKTSASADGQRRLAHGSTDDCSMPSDLGTSRRFRKRSPPSRQESCLIVRAGSSASLSALLEEPDCAYIQRYPRCNRVNCQLLLPFRERCLFFRAKTPHPSLKPLPAGEGEGAEARRGITSRTKSLMERIAWAWLRPPHWKNTTQVRSSWWRVQFPLGIPH